MPLIRLQLRFNRAFTLLELMVGLFIGALVSFMVIQSLIATTRLHQRVATETRVRTAISADFRLIETAMRGATGAAGILVRPDYSEPTETTATGTCVYLTNTAFASTMGLPANDFAFYYYNPTPAEPNTGGVYLDPDTNTVPNPAADRLLFRNVEAFEVRTGLNQAYRVAVRAQVRGGVRDSADSQGNKIYLSTSVIRRTPPGV